MKKVENEVIISALVSNRTIKAAADSIGISERTIYQRMKESEFHEDYERARCDLLRKTVSEVRSKVADALETIVEIMHDKNASAQIRLNAANCILNYSGKQAEQQAERLRAIEEKTLPHPPSLDDLFDY